MTQPNLLEQARQGNPEAIVHLLNRRLQSQGILAKATRQGACLQVMLESLDTPHQATSTALVKAELARLQPKSITSVSLFAIRQGEDFPDWTEDFDIAIVDAISSSYPTPKSHYNPATPIVIVEDSSPKRAVQKIDAEGWKALGAGLFLTVLIFALRQPAFLLQPLKTIVHELGHTFFSWIFGYPAIPSFDFIYGGGVTMQMERSNLIILLAYGAFGFAYYYYRHNYLFLRFLLAVIVIYSFCAFTALHEILFISMGHGFELLFAIVFIYRAISGYGCRYGLERPLYAMLGLFFIAYDIKFSYQLIYDPDFREYYEEGKGGLLDNDFVRIAVEYLRVDLSVVAGWFMACCFVVPILTLLLYRYRATVLYGLGRLFFVVDDRT